MTRGDPPVHQVGGHRSGVPVQQTQGRHGVAERQLRHAVALAGRDLPLDGLVPGDRNDVGVAGIHRLLNEQARLDAARVIVVVAGMEGALASVIGGLTSGPVVAVPTSVGYGASLDGITALLAMHASCASGVTVVGIDNGFGAACAIARMMQ